MYAQWVKNQDEINVLSALTVVRFALTATIPCRGVADSDGMMRQPAAPTREGYTFAGWYWVSDLSGLTDEQKDLNKVDFSQSIARQGLKPPYLRQWTKNADQNEIDVLYAANGGQFATGETFQQELTDSRRHDAPAAEPTPRWLHLRRLVLGFGPLRPHRRAEGPEQVDFSQSVAIKGARDRVRPVDQEPGADDHAVMYVAFNGGQFATGGRPSSRASPTPTA